MLSHPAHLPKRQDFSAAAALKISEILWGGERSEFSQRGDSGCAVLFPEKSHFGWGPRAGTWCTASCVSCHLSILMPPCQYNAVW